MKFKERLNGVGIYQKPCYYSNNPFYQSDYGLPNCTCYAWGRFAELTGTTPNLPLGNAGDWFADAQAAGVYETGQVPRLGAIACYSKDGRAGHVAVVEKILPNGDFVTSQSSYARPIADYPPNMDDYFFLSTCDDLTNKSVYMGNYNFDGFIYPPEYKQETPAKPMEDKFTVWLLFNIKE